MGRRYNRAKKAVGTNQHTSIPQSEGATSRPTAEKIAREHGLGRATVERAGQFADAVEKVKALAPSIEMDVAADWVDRNQLGRRNLHPDQFALLVGRRYNRAKKAVGAPDGNTNRVQLGNSYPIENVRSSAAIAAQHGLSEKTVRNAGQFADAIERVKSIAPGIEREVATGNTRAVLIAQVIAATVPRDVWCARISRRAL